MEQQKHHIVTHNINFGTAFIIGAGLALGTLVVLIIPYLIIFFVVMAVEI